jgi:hypothetical protein
MRVPKAVLLAVVMLGVSSPALAQANKSDYRDIDLKPLLPPVLPPLPSNSALTPGAVGSGAQSPHSSSLYDSPSTSQPAPGLRFSIPTR